MTDNRHFLHKVVDGVRDYGLEAAVLLVPVAFGVAQYFTTDEGVRLAFGDQREHPDFRTWMFRIMVATIILFVLVAIFHIWHVRRVSELDRRIGALERERETWRQGVQTFVQGLLVNLSQEKELSFGSKGRGGTERITIYTHDRGGYFVPFGRYSQDPEYDRITRTQYPEGQGCIWDTWRGGEHFDPDYPDPQTDPNGYVAHHVRNGLPETVARNLTMKSRLYYGWRIMDPTGVRNLAVIILEALDPNRYTIEDLREFFGKHGRSLSQMISTIAPTLPEATPTRKAGF